MIPINNVKGVTAYPNKLCTFEWSFKPLAIWMKIITGIRIDFNESGKCSLGRIGFILYSGLIFLANGVYVYIGTTKFCNAIQNTVVNDNKHFFNGTRLYLSDTGRLSFMIEYLNMIVLILFPHGWLFFFSLTDKWALLWNDWKQVQHMSLPFTFYRNLRRKSWFAVTLIILVGKIIILILTIASTLLNNFIDDPDQNMGTGFGRANAREFKLFACQYDDWSFRNYDKHFGLCYGSYILEYYGILLDLNQRRLHHFSRFKPRGSAKQGWRSGQPGQLENTAQYVPEVDQFAKCLFWPIHSCGRLSWICFFDHRFLSGCHIFYRQ